MLNAGVACAITDGESRRLVRVLVISRQIGFTREFVALLYVQTILQSVYRILSIWLASLVWSDWSSADGTFATGVTLCAWERHRLDVV